MGAAVSNFIKKEEKEPEKEREEREGFGAVGQR